MCWSEALFDTRNEKKFYLVNWDGEREEQEGEIHTQTDHELQMTFAPRFAIGVKP